MSSHRNPTLTTVEIPLGVAYSADGTRPAVWFGSGRVLVMDARTTTPLTGHRGRVRSVAVSRDQRLIAAAGDDDTVSVWNTAAGSRWATPSGHTEMIMSVVWSGDGTSTTGSRDQSITPWVVDADKAVGILCGASERDFPGGGPAEGCHAR